MEGADWTVHLWDFASEPALWQILHDCEWSAGLAGRRLMARMQADRGMRLDWVAVDHFNTGHPHTHIIVRGKDDSGRDLVIAPEDLTKGTRKRAAELVGLDPGPRSDREIECTLRADVEQERPTSIDRPLLRERGPDLTVVAAAPEPFRQTLRSGRLAKLERLGLAQSLGGGADVRGAWPSLCGDRGRAAGGGYLGAARRPRERALLDRAKGKGIHLGAVAPRAGAACWRGAFGRHARRRRQLVVWAIQRSVDLEDGSARAHHPESRHPFLCK